MRPESCADRLVRIIPRLSPGSPLKEPARFGPEGCEPLACHGSTHACSPSWSQRPCASPARALARAPIFILLPTSRVKGARAVLRSLAVAEIPPCSCTARFLSKTFKLRVARICEAEVGHEVTKSNDGEALGVAILPRAPMVSGLSAAQTKEQSPFSYQQRERGMTQFLRPDSILLSQRSGEQSGKYPRWASRRGLRLSRVDRGSVRPTVDC